MSTVEEWPEERERLINKPSWEDAPEWAQWLAQHPSGKWYWHTDPPVACPADEGWFALHGKFEVAAMGEIPAGHHWWATLDQRPTEEFDSEARMTVIATNGNDGLHYPKQERYQDQQGEDWIDEFARTATVEEFRGAMRFTIGKYNRRAGKKDKLISEISKMEDYCRRWREFEESQEATQ